MTKVIGITGGLASGKTTIVNFFLRENIPVFIADNVSKSLMAANHDIVRKVKSVLGDQAYLDNGEINRQFIANEIFSNNDKRKRLNDILHPKVYEAFEIFKQQHSGEKILCYESALIYQTGFDKKCDAVIFVSASVEVRTDRAIKRGLTTEDVENRFISQGNLDVYESKADFVIHNSENLENLEGQFHHVYQELNQRFRS